MNMIDKELIPYLFALTSAFELVTGGADASLAPELSLSPRNGNEDSADPHCEAEGPGSGAIEKLLRVLTRVLA